MPESRLLAPATRSYRGVMTDPDRWALYRPRPGDILVCTPPKCGTTWTQTIVASLLSGGRPLPAPVPVLSPWIDSTLGEAAAVAAALDRQNGRRVVKTHTPADGFPVWEGVHVVAVYRHPLDVFLSLRNHGMNMKNRPDHPMRRPLDVAFAEFLSGTMTEDDFDSDTLDGIVAHFRRTADRSRLHRLTLLHYADMIADRAGTVAGLARALGIAADGPVLERVVAATGFAEMKSRASEFAPEGGKGFWADDGAFFNKGGTGNWEHAFGPEEIAAYEARMAALVPEPDLRRWFEMGGPNPIG